MHLMQYEVFSRCLDIHVREDMTSVDPHTYIHIEFHSMEVDSQCS